MGSLVRAPGGLAPLTDPFGARPDGLGCRAPIRRTESGTPPEAAHGYSPGRVGGNDVHMGSLVRAPGGLAPLTDPFGARPDGLGCRAPIRRTESGTPPEAAHGYSPGRMGGEPRDPGPPGRTPDELAAMILGGAV
ncbi:hypothetical protein GCM10010339_10310 [Streptomyces alanosinicus]|uniref:Uncharacterized protein n=1 Tax=Streptomyces alanosinicus TaxID=68171 RepID=A0A919CZP0_9ACTN|nr:hypothetical protein GCM10010339_10310 [Streptomyces alanosinicus]